MNLPITFIDKVDTSWLEQAIPYLSDLTPRERCVIHHVGLGYTLKEIADLPGLKVSRKTVDKQFHSAKEKMYLDCRRLRVLAVLWAHGVLVDGSTTPQNLKTATA